MSRASTRVQKADNNINQFKDNEIRVGDEHRNKQVFSDRGINGEALNNINKSTKM